MFTLDDDLAFYVWMKANLPDPFRIEARPSAKYYSEWNFCYVIYKGEELLETIEGDYRMLAPGTLINKANAFMEIMAQGDE